MDLSTLSDHIYQSMFYQGLIFSSLGLLLRGIVAPGEDGISRGIGLNNYLCDRFPAYATYAPAVAHFLVHYGGTLVLGSKGNFVVGGIDLASSNLMLPFLYGAVAMWAMGAYEIGHDLYHGKTTKSDILQWCADFAGPALALVVARTLLY